MTQKQTRATSGVLYVLALILVAIPHLAGASPAARLRDPQDEARFAAPLDAISPRLGADFARATQLMDDDKTADALAAFSAVLAKAPTHAPTLWRLSSLSQVQRNKKDALRYAREAYAAENVWQAKLTLAEALLLSPTTGAEVKEAEPLIGEIKTEHPGPSTTMAAITLALQHNDLDQLGHEVGILETQAADIPGTFFYKALWLANIDKLDEANTALQKAVALGFPQHAADDFAEGSGIAEHARRWRYAKWGAGILAGWLAALAMLFLAGRWLSHKVLSAVEKAAGDTAMLDSTTLHLRKVYGWMIGAGAVYFYISIPIVISVVVLLAGGVIMAFWALGRIPIKLCFILAIGAAISVWSMLKSLIVKRGPDTPLGRPLTEPEAPQLWRLLRDVAARVNTRPVDAVFMTAGTDIAVVETGGMMKRLRDQGQRSLILGLGVLPDMTVDQFSAILAHEYGHFSNRDTARGDVALIVQASLFNSALGIARGGGASWINPAWLFINGFHSMYLRITHGASRLQEVMADKFAATAYGAEAFSEGLVHAIRRSIEFPRNVDELVKTAEKSRQPIANLYVPASRSDVDPNEPSIESALAEALADPGSPFDSHPPPAKRIEWVGRMAGSAKIERSHVAVWDLFPTRTALENEMTQNANGSLIAQGLIEDAALPDEFKPMNFPASVS